MRSFIIRNKYILLALLILIIYLSPNIFFPHEARFLIHDNLDSNVVWYKNLAESGKMFAPSNAIIERSMGGLPRGCYPSEFNILHLLYLLFSPLTAYNLNIIIIHFAAFFSMYLFSRKYIFKFSSELLTVGTSLLFSLLPFWPSGGLAITAQPLLLFAFLNILNKELNWKNWVIIIAIPFYSVLILSNFFFIIVLTVGALFYFFYKRKINYYFIGAICLFSLISILVEYRLFYMQFVEHFQSHRTGIRDFGALNLKGVIGVSFLHFLKGHFHFHSLQFPFTLVLTCLALILVKEKTVKLKLLTMLGLALIFSLTMVLPDWNVLQNFMAKHDFFSSVTPRFYSLFPLLWFSILAYSTYALCKNYTWMKKVVIVIFSVMLITELFSLNDKDYYSSEYAENSFYRTLIDKNNTEYASFNEFYKTDFFKKVKEKLPPGNFYIACIGIDPEIIQYNGYNTIDGYFYYYSRQYRDLMNLISKSELAKSKKKTLGNRCYLWSNDLIQHKTVIDSLDLNFPVLKTLGTKYIFSSEKIINKDLSIDFAINDNTTKNQLFVYQIKN